MGIEITPPPHTHKKSKNQSGCKYLKWVDTAKAIGVYLVVWGHLLPTGSYVAGRSRAPGRFVLRVCMGVEKTNKTSVVGGDFIE